VGTVNAVNATSVILEYRGGLITNVGYVDQYIPVVGDVVHAISQQGQGVLIVGSNNVAPQPVSQLPLPTVLTVNATQWASYAASAWSSGVLVQSPSSWACWFYPVGAFASLSGRLLASFEFEVVLAAGGPPEFVAHATPAPAGTLTLRDTFRHAPIQPAVGVATWVPLPLDWGAAMVSGEMAGVAIGGGIYSGTYSGTSGRVRITTL
jgi:hypothetical protein